MGLNTFAIFLGLGLGSLIFGQLTVHFGIAAFAMFAGFQIGIGLLSLRAFKKE